MRTCAFGSYMLSLRRRDIVLIIAVAGDELEHVSLDDLPTTEYRCCTSTERMPAMIECSARPGVELTESRLLRPLHSQNSFFLAQDLSLPVADTSCCRLQDEREK